MSTYEKIASVLLVLLVGVSLTLWFSRRDEPMQGHRDFDESTGQDFHMGPFDALIDQEVSGGAEERCDMLQPVLIAALHDIDERLGAQAQALGIGSWDDFEVNAAALKALCNVHATFVLADRNRDTLTITKAPFVRSTPPGGSAADIGTLVSIDAVVHKAGTPMPAGPQAQARVLVPDRFLLATSTTP